MAIDLLAFNSQKYSNNLFLKNDREELSYKEAEDKASYIAGALFNFIERNFSDQFTLNLQRKVVIATLLGSKQNRRGMDYVLIVLACHRIRKVKKMDIRLLPLNPNKPVKILKEEIFVSKTDFLIHDQSQGSLQGINHPNCSLNELTDGCFEINSIKYDNGSDDHYSSLDDFMDKDDQEPFIYLFTSGSSGKSKIAVFSWANWLRSAKSGDCFFPFRQGDCWLHLLPFYHVSGMGILFRALLHGAAIVFTEQKDWQDILISHRITHVSLVSAQIIRPDQDKLRALKFGLVGGGAIPDSLIPYLYPHTPLRPTYGLTESVAYVATFDGFVELESDNFFLKILPSRRIKIKDGEIFIHKDTLFLGYLKKEGEVEEPWDGEWFVTGDMGEKRGDYLSVKGRKDRLFISGGENIHPEGIERAILSYPGFPGVDKVSVFPIFHERWGKVPAAALCLNGEKLSLISLIKHLHNVIEHYKVPQVFYLLPESFCDSENKLSYRAVEEAYIKDELLLLNKN